MAPAGAGGMKGFYRQTKKIKGGGVAKPSATTTKRSKNKPQQCTKDESHGEDQEEEEEELRRFDMDMAYGPCIGITRLRRWERAAAVGVPPPLASRSC